MSLDELYFTDLSEVRLLFTQRDLSLFNRRALNPDRPNYQVDKSSGVTFPEEKSELTVVHFHLTQTEPIGRPTVCSLDGSEQVAPTGVR